MKHYLIYLIILNIILLPIQASSELTQLTNDQMDAVTAQAGIHVDATQLKHDQLSFNQAFGNSNAGDVNAAPNILGFDQAFAKPQHPQQIANNGTLNFDTAFQNRRLDNQMMLAQNISIANGITNFLGVNLFDSGWQKIDVHYHWDNITFAQAFQQTSGMNMGLEKTVLNDFHIKNWDVRITGDIRITFRP